MYTHTHTGAKVFTCTRSPHASAVWLMLVPLCISYLRQTVSVEGGCCRGPRPSSWKPPALISTATLWCLWLTAHTYFNSDTHSPDQHSTQTHSSSITLNILQYCEAETLWYEVVRLSTERKQQSVSQQWIPRLSAPHTHMLWVWWWYHPSIVNRQPHWNTQTSNSFSVWSPTGNQTETRHFYSILILDASWRVRGRPRSRQGQCLNAVILVCGTEVEVMRGNVSLEPSLRYAGQDDFCHGSWRCLF